jgi:hypothetical protein
MAVMGSGDREVTRRRLGSGGAVLLGGVLGMMGAS